MSDAHDDHFGNAFDGDDLPPHVAVPDEPKSPLWLPFLGAGLLAVVLTWWLSTPTAEEEARAAAAASASASASASGSNAEPPPSPPPPSPIPPTPQPALDDHNHPHPAGGPPPTPAGAPGGKPAKVLPGGLKAPGADLKQVKVPH